MKKSVFSLLVAMGLLKAYSIHTNNNIFNQLNVGFPAGGLSFVDKYGDKIWVDGTDLILNPNIENDLFYAKIKKYNPYGFYNLHKYLKNSKYLVYWLVRDWQEDWFYLDGIQEAMDKGYIPVFNYAYFEDSLINFPTDEEIEEYYKNVEKVANFLSKLKGKKLLIFEPEFNKNSVVGSEEKSKKFAKIISKAIDIVKKKDKNILVSLCMMDTGDRGVNQHYKKCGYKNCALGDKYEWSRPDKVYKYLKNKLDFFSFQEIVLQFSRDPHNPGDWDNPNPISYTPDEVGIKYLANRIVNLTKFLHDKYHKPVLLPYIGIASAVWNDKDGDGKISSDEINKNGWNKYITLTYKKLRKYRKKLKNNGLFGYAPMNLIDDPRHDFGGYQFGLQNEYHLGIIKTSAKDEKDKAAYGDLIPKGTNLLTYIYAPTKKVYEQNVRKNEIECIKEGKSYCKKIADIKLKNYYDMAIEKTKKEKNQEAILIPLYSYPDLGDDNSIWEKVVKLKKKYRDKRIVAIVNPDNGDFDYKNRDFVNGIRTLSKAGVEVVGYVYTNYGNREKSQIIKDINRWNKFYKLYGVRGIFFDEVSTDEDKLAYYTNLVNYAKSKGFYFDILNPGIKTAQIYVDAGIADVIVDYENSYENLQYQTEFNEPSKLTSLGFLIYGAKKDKVEELYNFAEDKNFDYFYFTDDNDGNPWDSISSYLNTELKIMK